jgi:transcriptional regulator with XRE-family HTH domain
MGEPVTDDGTIGRRIAHYRKLKGWSQRELARRVGYSFSQVEKIERGVRGVDRYSTLFSFARALDIDVAELTGEPRRRRGQREHSTVPLIRRALTALPLGVEDGPVRPLDELRRDVRGAIATRQRGKYANFGQQLPVLLEELARAIDAVPDGERSVANALLAETLHAGSTLLRRLGYVDLSWIAAQQARTPAQRSADPLLPIATDWHVIELCFRTGNTARALRLAEQAIDRLDEHLGRDQSPQAVSLVGTMHLLRAMAAAQWADRRDTEDALAQAARAADHNRVDRDDYQTLFGPSNVAVFGVATAVELGDGDEAARRVNRIEVDAIPTRERQARYLIDVARAYAQNKRDPAALHVISDAHKRAPEYVLNHVMAREVVAELLERERRSITPGLRTLAKKMGIA